MSSESITGNRGAGKIKAEDDKTKRHVPPSPRPAHGVTQPQPSQRSLVLTVNTTASTWTYPRRKLPGQSTSETAARPIHSQFLSSTLATHESCICLAPQMRPIPVRLPLRDLCRAHQWTLRCQESVWSLKRAFSSSSLAAARVSRAFCFQAFGHLVLSVIPVSITNYI
jgi:hypothetical protein